jgi:hypothetical protein
MNLRRLATSCAFAALLVPCIATAQPAQTPVAGALPTPEQEAEARTRFERGIALFNSGDFNGALGEFQTAFDLSRRPSVLYNLGATHHALHHYPEAARTFEQYLHTANIAPERRAQVEQWLAEIRQFIARITLVGLPPGASVRVDGQPVPPDALAPLLVSTGQHSIEVEAEGFREARESITIAGGQERELRINMQRREANGGGAAGMQSAVIVRTTPPNATIAVDGAPASSGERVNVGVGSRHVRISANGFGTWEGDVDVGTGITRVLTVRLAETGRMGPAPFAIAAGATVVFAGLTTVFGVMTLGTLGQFEMQTRESTQARDLASAGETQRLLTNVFLIGTGVAAVATGILFFRTSFGPRTAMVDMAFAPHMEGGGSGRLSIRF